MEFSVKKNDKKIFLRHGHEVMSHMKQLISYNVANELHSITITRGYFYLRNRIYVHLVSYLECFCYERRLMHLLFRILVERDDQIYLFHLNVSNYDDLHDLDVLGRTLVTHM